VVLSSIDTAAVLPTSSTISRQSSLLPIWFERFSMRRSPRIDLHIYICVIFARQKPSPKQIERCDLESIQPQIGRASDII